MNIKVLLICPSSLIHMPYAREYINYLSGLGAVDLTVVTWDRFRIEELSVHRYRDNKTGHRRTLFDYYLFSRFVKRKIRDISPNKIVIFGIPLIFILSSYIKKELDIKSYVLDIRDYHRSIIFFNIKLIINNSYFTTISSPGFRRWLPDFDRYITHHNSDIKTLDGLESSNRRKGNSSVVVSCIGALKDFEVNRGLIDHLANNKLFKLRYDGEGVINDSLKVYLKKNNISNVEISGRYIPEDEDLLYRRADIINMLMTRNHINNESCLSNRLYRSLVFGKPLIVFSGSLIAKIIEKYNLGLVIDVLDNVDREIIDYLSRFQVTEYNLGRAEFLKCVVSDNKLFKASLLKFIFDKSRDGKVLSFNRFND